MKLGPQHTFTRSDVVCAAGNAEITPPLTRLRHDRSELKLATHRDDSHEDHSPLRRYRCYASGGNSLLIGTAGLRKHSLAMHEILGDKLRRLYAALRFV